MKSVLNWLGLALLLLTGAVLVYVNDAGRSEKDPEKAVRAVSPVSGSPSATPMTLLPAVSAAHDSPLLASPLSPPPTPRADPDVYRLTVLHTNDTWGYLLPCG